MNLFKTSFYTAISTAITFISGFIVTKVVAVKIGPEGMAFAGQFQNTASIFVLLATAAIVSGVVKYLAEYAGNKEAQQKIIHTGISIILISSLILSLLIMVTSGYLSKVTFHTFDFWIVYFLYGLFIVLIALNSFFNAVYNGLKQIRSLTVVNVTGSLVGIFFTVIMAIKFGVKGVLIANNFTALIIFIINIYFIKRLDFSFKPRLKQWDKNILKSLFAFTLMSIVSGLISPIMQILVRDRIITSFSLADAGMWQGVNKISDYYLSFIITILTVYYLPRYSEIKNRKDLLTEIKKAYITILPVVAVMALSVWLVRGLIVQILFTPQFVPMMPLFKYQLLGDFFKIGSWLIGFVMVSKAMLKVYIITEVLFSATYVAWCFYFMSKYGIIGATYGFCLNLLIYWIVIIFIIKKYIKASPVC